MQEVKGKPPCTDAEEKCAPLKDAPPFALPLAFPWGKVPSLYGEADEGLSAPCSLSQAGDCKSPLRESIFCGRRGDLWSPALSALLPVTSPSSVLRLTPQSTFISGGTRPRNALCGVCPGRRLDAPPFAHHMSPLPKGGKTRRSRGRGDSGKVRQPLSENPPDFAENGSATPL